jgi:hypothetical protein
VACATEAPGSAQDCNTSDITISAAAAARCCFTFRDAAPDRAVGPADAAPDNGDGGGNEGGNSEGANTEDGNNQGGNGEGGGASMCASAGGSCLHNSVQCAGRAPTGAQDCNNPPNPAGDFCCLTVPDAGPDLDAGAADAGLSNDDGANGDGGGTSPLCAAAGGTCINSTVMCGQGAPPTAQDCPFDPLGAYCCITTL